MTSASQLRKADGATFWASASARRVTFGGEPAVLVVFKDITAKLVAEEALKASEERLAAQSHALTTLTAQHAVPQGTFEQRLRTILEVAASTLKAGRLSLWRMAPDGDSIRCDGLYCLSPPGFTCGGVVTRADAPSYFAALEQDRMIAATTRAPIRGRAISARAICAPRGIGAMLDVPLRSGRPHVRRALRRARGRHARVDGRRAELRPLGRQSRRRWRSPTRSGCRRWRVWPTARRGPGSSSTRRTTRSSASTPPAASSRGTPRPRRLRVDARRGRRGATWSTRVIPPAYREAHERGMERFLETGEAPVVNRGSS